jgi:hypothetical protein
MADRIIFEKLSSCGSPGSSCSKYYVMMVTVMSRSLREFRQDSVVGSFGLVIPIGKHSKKRASHPALPFPLYFLFHKLHKAEE